MATASESRNASSSSKKRTRVSRPYPVHTLEEALAIATTIQEKNAGLAFDRVLLAKAMGTTPASSGFTTRLNSSAKYGLTEGGYTDARIALTARGTSIVAPRPPDERRRSMLEAALEPGLFRSFYELLDGNRLPEDAYVRSVLERDLDVQPSLTEECLRIIVDNGLAVGVLGDVGGSLYVSMSGSHLMEPGEDGASQAGPPAGEAVDGVPQSPAADVKPQTDRGPGTRIFVGHAGNSDIVEYLKEVLDPFGIPYVVVDSDYDATRPLAVEVTDRMRECTAAILVFAKATDSEWKGRREDKRSQKMMYQLGAASALYGERVVVFTEASKASPHDQDFHTLEFHRDEVHELGLVILAQLHRLGVIQVTI